MSRWTTPCSWAVLSDQRNPHVLWDMTRVRWLQRISRRGRSTALGNAPPGTGFAATMGKRRIPRVRAATPRTLRGSLVVDELDLHGLSVDQAERRLESFLTRVAAREPNGVVRIVTGKGTRSDGPPQIRDMVLEALGGWLADSVGEWSIDVGAGAYLVRVQR